MSDDGPVAAFSALLTSFLVESKVGESRRGVSSDVAISHSGRLSSICWHTLQILSVTTFASSVVKLFVPT